VYYLIQLDSILVGITFRIGI